MNRMSSLRVLLVGVVPTEGVVVAEAGLCGMADRGPVRIRGPVDGSGQSRGLFCRRTLFSCASVGARK